MNSYIAPPQNNTVNLEMVTMHIGERLEVLNIRGPKLVTRVARVGSSLVVASLSKYNESLGTATHCIRNH